MEHREHQVRQEVTVLQGLQVLMVLQEQVEVQVVQVQVVHQELRVARELVGVPVVVEHPEVVDCQVLTVRPVVVELRVRQVRPAHRVILVVAERQELRVHQVLQV